MNEMPLTQWIAVTLTALYGIISLAGGIMGYLKGSWISLLAGGGAGVLLLLSALGVFFYKTPIWPLVSAIVVALLLLGKFAPTLFTKRQEMSETMYIVAIVMVVGGALVVIASVFALLTQPRPPSGA